MTSIRVLVAEDFEPFRRFFASTFRGRPELQVICEVSDGLEAVQKVAELQPDLIVLDLHLPKLNGIEAARRIRELAPRSRILVVSQESSADVVREALRVGAAGYVVKTDAGRELMTAVDAVLRGEQFVGNRFSGIDFASDLDPGGTGGVESPRVLTPSLAQTQVITRRHEVDFYSDDRCFLDGFIQFIGDALSAGHAAIVFATQANRERLLQKLRTQGPDIRAAMEQGRYVPLDATETLSTFMVKDQIDPVRFRKIAGDLILRAAQTAKGEPPRLAVCGEGATLLWEQGNADAAIHLEQLWNEMTQIYRVDVLCAYRLITFQGGLGSHIFGKLCAEHSAVHSR